ncbi:MAG: hypothetical protein EHM60_06705 [Lysobacterales bacterium]|jgi:hypothetical protein|nr:MAG: hypothetical protein EHM60_06705 [Xanthomonadales bacterium]
MIEKPRGPQDEAFERRARELFDASVDGLDAATRARLAAARHAAVSEAGSRRGATWRGWAPVAIAVSAALVAVIVWRAPGDAPSGTTGPAGAPALDALELVAAGEDLDLVAEDLEFYAWLDELSLEAVAAQGTTS